MESAREIFVFADGASKGNPGPGGWGAVFVFGDKVQELGGYEAHTTNNRMELTAALRGLKAACAHEGERPIVIHTDSSYVIKGVTKWLQGWEQGGWKTKQKKDVLNQDLWRLLAEAVAACKSPVAWEHVPGHSGVAGNERVDAIATEFAEKKKPALYTGALSGYGIEILNTHHDPAKQKARAARTRSVGKAYSYVSELRGVVQVHQTWAECEARVKGKPARFKKATSVVEEVALIKEFSSR